MQILDTDFSLENTLKTANRQELKRRLGQIEADMEFVGRVSMADEPLWSEEKLRVFHSEVSTRLADLGGAEIDMIIFDVDSTLVRLFADETAFLPGVENFFRQLPPEIKIALATNQGGVGLRRWMEEGGFGEDYERLPREAEAHARISAVAAKIEEWAGREAPFLISYRFLSSKGNWSTLPPESQVDGSTRIEWTQDWRKPRPGMLLHLAAQHVIDPARILYVGDQLNDYKAAEAAGLSFAFHRLFFWPHFDPLIFRYTSLFVYGWLRQHERRGLDVISTLARFERVIAKNLQIWEDVGPVEFVRDDDLDEPYVIELGDTDVGRFDRQIYDLDIDKRWLVYESPEAHAEALRFCKDVNVRVTLHLDIERAYGISHDEAHDLVHSGGQV